MSEKHPLCEKPPQKRVRRLKKFFCDILKSVLLTVLLYTALWYLAHGWFLTGLPGEEEIVRVTVAFEDYSHETTDPEDIHLARSLANCLHYRLWGEPQGQPLVTMTYHLADGEAVHVSANETTVWWRGKAHPLHDDNTFVNLTRGVFPHPNR